MPSPTRRYQLELLPLGDPRRAEIEARIAAVFAQHYAAQVEDFLPLLAVLYQDQQPLAACGLQPAEQGPLFLEQYLDLPAETILAERLGITAPARTALVEVGNLASFSPQASPLLFAALAQLLLDDARQWVLFTGTDTLLHHFDRLRLHPHFIADANAARLGTDQYRWGSYYRHCPRVMAGDLQQAQHYLKRHSLLPQLLAPLPRLRSPALEECCG